jgi:hypothetical protein
MDDIFIKIFLSLVLGGVLGMERQYHDKPAGFATNCLICLGAMLFTALSEFMYGQGGDPGRIAAQIVTGLGFIGGVHSARRKQNFRPDHRRRRVAGGRHRHGRGIRPVFVGGAFGGGDSRRTAGRAQNA